MKKYLMSMVFAGIFFVALYGASSENRKLISPEYGTHMAPLLTVIANTDGPILEMGCGDYSTPLVHAVCSVSKRFVLTAETDIGWMELFKDLKTDWHQFVYVNIGTKNKNYNPEAWNLIGNDHNWSVVFIDHAPKERRVVDIERLRLRTAIFVVHDTNPLKKGYKYEPLLSTFKYRFNYKRYANQTTIVSDVIDVAAFFPNKS